MCLYVGSEVILANLLDLKNGVSQEDVALYCQKLRDTLSNDNHKVYINLNDKEINNALAKYNREFRFFQGHYFINKDLNLSHFNARYDNNIVSTFARVAQMI